ncbi:MAG: hypothetical protein H2045_11100 [Rhizobiales bacterium]|nr:hypothetical protein [Hyphomicrobiales bacterium]
MAETKQERAKRLAAALRENLKRRKSQMRGLSVAGNLAPEPPVESKRRFREKPLKPDTQE